MTFKGKGSLKKIVVLGVGNILLRDEGVGIYVVNELAKEILPKNVEVVDGGLVGRDFLPLLERADKLIIVNILKRDDKPGTCLKPGLSEVERALKVEDTSIDQLALFSALDDVKVRGNCPEIVVVSVVPKEVDVGMGLSRELQESIPTIIERIKEEFDHGSKKEDSKERSEDTK
ncbi:hydrogenase maturation protease [Candidatus Oleimmundimicrobium sp.]|uniref:hydrogenase maturation protease n=1 Tax=Candidatus Oleimmundimicrobium sp. TaxID=3060597 RepID=UPI002716A8C6|nr:hydrogenase maturation protease [Candidatus Oleimmundimicrobium sp.]MDO8886325.1 hydrogenase maturation protease [Candidatus Oleimmundimicrobium sp.]